MNKVLIAMSGGVDSSVAAFLLKENGYDVDGITMRLLRDDVTTDTNCKDAQAVAEHLGFSLHVVSYYDAFETNVINDFLECYKNGLTPNPCVTCNRAIKFGALLDTAASLGYEKLATGHYVNIVKDSNGKLFLSKAKDKQKDQSYFLWSINKDSLSRLIFPLGDLTKSEIRELAQKNGLVTANRPDSQDICFIKNGEYASFIKQRSSCDFPCGDFVDVNGNVLGKHEGIINYTVGQRKGLGMAFGVPMFVGKKNAYENTVTLCTNDELFCDTLTASSINLFVDDDTLDMPVRLQAKIRYRHEPTVATVRRISDDELSVKFDVPQRAITPGQSVVLYDGDTVIGGGIIN